MRGSEALVDSGTGGFCVPRAHTLDGDYHACTVPADASATALFENLVGAAKPLHDCHRHPQYAAGRRISQSAAFFHLGELVEVGDTEQIFTPPKTQRCLDFVTGRYG